MNDHPRPDAPPETWAPAHRVAQALLRPLERFLHVEAASGAVLLVAAAVALVWANSPWRDSYEHLWHTPVTIGFGDLVSRASLHFWVNEGLMAIFFFVVGLEIRREIHAGELSVPRRAALPVLGALGGMALPAVLYAAMNPAPELRGGWGVPTATDIAFAVGVLALLGKRVAPALRVLLLAIAIIDDIGAIVVIALFYSSGVEGSGLGVAAAGAVLVLLFQRLGVRRPLAYVAPGAVVWLGMLRAGVHPTIAGVILGLLTPVRSWFGEQGFLEAARHAVEEFRARAERARHGPEDLLGPLERLKVARREALPPVVRIQAALHPWVAYGIMPVFALANAGVSLEGVSLSDAGARTVAFGVTAGLVLGKPLGILAASFLGVQLRLCALPRGVSWRGVALVGTVAGIGFTMAIFIAGLAFRDAAMLAAAKLGVLCASAIASAAGLALGSLMLPARAPEEAAATADLAEASTDQ